MKAQMRKHGKITIGDGRMNLQQFHATYGNQATDELLDAILICDYDLGSGGWRMFALRYGFVKKTMLTVREWYTGLRKDDWYYQNGHSIRLPTPMKYHSLTLRNGSKVSVLTVQIHEYEIHKYQEGKLNETSPNQPELS